MSTLRAAAAGALAAVLCSAALAHADAEPAAVQLAEVQAQVVDLSAEVAELSDRLDEIDPESRSTASIVGCLEAQAVQYRSVLLADGSTRRVLVPTEAAFKRTKGVRWVAQLADDCLPRYVGDRSHEIAGRR